MSVPPKPWYEFIWDTELVLQFLKNFRYRSETSYSENSYPLDFIVWATGEHDPPI